MTPYYEEAGITIYHGDCRDFAGAEDSLSNEEIFLAAVMLTDPPYGISYKSNRLRIDTPASIVGDDTTELRDSMLYWWGDNSALVFGSWKITRPRGTHTRLIWDTKGALGMGDLSIPWKPSDQEIYVMGKGFHGHRGSNILRYAPVQSMGRHHPHEKPVELLSALLKKCPQGKVFDPFMGSGTTLVAAKEMGRQAVGIEIDERYCEIAANRLRQSVLNFEVCA